MENTEIKRMNEKSAIIFYNAKKQSNEPLTLETYIAQWKSHWKKDFKQFKKDDGSYNDDEIHKCFEIQFKADNQEYCNLSKEAMYSVRKEFAMCESMHCRLHHFADRRNLIISKAPKKAVGYTLGGFRISRQHNGATVVGGDYSLSLHEVCTFFDVSEDEKQRFIREIQERNIDRLNGRSKNIGNKKQQRSRKKYRQKNKR